LFYTINKEISLKPLIKLAAFIELISKQKSKFLRAKKASLLSKIRKGAPLGVITFLRRKSLFRFLFSFVYKIFPNLPKNKKENKINSYSFQSNAIKTISVPFVFPELHKFYLFFKSCTNLRMSIVFPKKVSKMETLFNKRISLISF